MTIKAYLKPSCGWSNGVRAILRKYSLDFHDIDIIGDRACYAEMVRKSGQPLSPCIEVDGVMLATYPFHAGHFTINALNIVDSMGSPATDRLLLNLVIQAQVDAAGLAPLPPDYEPEMDKLGFKD